MPLTFLPFILLLVPVLEITVFIVIGGKIGALWTIGMVLFTAVLGSILLRIEGFRTITQVREKMNAGQIPGEELAKGALILVAGILLLTPGFISDTIGFSLFLPFVRKFIWNFLSSRFKIQGAAAMHGMGGGMGFDINNDRGPSSDFRQNNKNPKTDIVDLDPDEFSENPNPDSPWSTGVKKK